MATTFGFPSNAELSEVAQDKMPNLVEARDVFKIFPMTDSDDALVMWDQMDNFTGLQQIRGVNGQPPSITKSGLSRYMMKPGIYGEFDPINEMDLLFRRRPGSFATAINISDLVMQSQDKLLQRRLDRVELIIWTLLTTGAFSVYDATGQLAQTDTFAIQTFASAVPWATAATATPLADMRQMQLDAFGHSVSFGSDSELWINRPTWNNLISNTNPADLYGRRTAGLGLINNVSDINKLLAGDDLPQIHIYDQGYIADPVGGAPGVATRFIPTNKGVLVGKRPAGQVVGEYKMTRNVENPDLAPGPYMRVIDRGGAGSGEQVPRTIEVHDGHNGGPAIFYPSAIVALSC